MAVYGYAQPADLVSFGLPATTLAGASTAVQEDALEGASRLADSYLRKRYPLPLLSWGKELTRCVCHIASWDLTCRYGANPALAHDQWIEKRHDLALLWLKDVADGKAEPGVTAPPAVIDDTQAQNAPTVQSEKPNAWGYFQGDRRGG